MLIRVSEELLERWLTRDADCNRLSFELGEPDNQGVFCPEVTRHYDDNPLREAEAERDFSRRVAQTMAHDWWASEGEGRTTPKAILDAVERFVRDHDSEEAPS